MLNNSADTHDLKLKLHNAGDIRPATGLRVSPRVCLHEDVWGRSPTLERSCRKRTQSNGRRLGSHGAGYSWGKEDTAAMPHQPLRFIFLGNHSSNMEDTFHDSSRQLWLQGVQTPLRKDIIGHQCLVNLSRNWLAIWTGVLIATDWGVSSAVTSDVMHCFLKWMAFLTLVLIRCSRRILMQATLVDLRALWVITVPTVLHASSLLIAATLQGSGLLSPCHRLGSR